MLMVYVRTGYVSSDTMFWEFNDGGNKKACRITMKRNCEKSVNMLSGLC